MNKPFFRRCLVFATLGASSLAFTACGGGSDIPAPPAVAAEVQNPAFLVAADNAAATREQQ